jgi:alkylmercury lyase
MTSQILQDAIKRHEAFVSAQPEECQLLLHLVRFLAEGLPVSPEQLAAVSHHSVEDIRAFLQCSDVEVNAEGNIVGLGLSLQPTQHQFRLGEKTLYTWCALDTLLFPAVLNCTAQVTSSCPATGKKIHLTVTPAGIEYLEPRSAVISVRLPGAETDLCHVRGTICMQGHFFADRAAASAWPGLHPQAILISVEEAAELGRELAPQFLTLGMS